MLIGGAPIGALPQGATNPTANSPIIKAAVQVIKGLIVDLRNMMGR